MYSMLFCTFPSPAQKARLFVHPRHCRCRPETVKQYPHSPITLHSTHPPAPLNQPQTCRCYEEAGERPSERCGTKPTTHMSTHTLTHTNRDLSYLETPHIITHIHTHTQSVQYASSKLGDVVRRVFLQMLRGRSRCRGSASIAWSQDWMPTMWTRVRMCALGLVRLP